MSAEATTNSEGTRSSLPLLGLLALATTSFLTTLTEALPAGVLPQMGADLGVSELLGGTTRYSLCNRLPSGRYSADDGDPQLAETPASHHDDCRFRKR